MTTIKIRGKQSIPFMAGFEPAKTLWGHSTAPYPSEDAARWAMRKMRDELAKAGAVALHRNRLLVHAERFAAVAERFAITEFSDRVLAQGTGE